jgi:chemotaxis protein CheX
MLVTDDAFYTIIQNTWASTLGFQVDCPPSAELTAIGALSVSVKITGAWDGEVRLHCPPPLARLIAAAIFQVEAENVGSEEILDALSELIHIVGGNLKALLPQPVTLSLPSLPNPAYGPHATPPWQIVTRLTLVSEGHPFVVTILGNSPAPVTVENPAGRERSSPAENS